MEIIYSSKFAREYKKLPLFVKIYAEKLENVFRKNPFDPRLKTHKLTGRLNGFWAFSLGYHYRIIFEFDKDKNIVYFHSAGDHDIYRHP